MASSASPRLPPEVIFRILDRAFDAPANWDVSRQYLPLRSVSSWFGSYLEESLFSHIHVDVDVQPFSASDQLRQLLQTNAKLAATLRHLTVTDHKVFCEHDGVGVEDGTLALQASREMLLQRTALQHEYLKSLLGACSKLRVLNIFSWYRCIPPPNSIFSSEMSELKVVLLQGEAVATHLLDFMRAGRHNTTLAICPPSFAGVNSETLGTLTSRLDSDWTQPPFSTERLYFAHSPIDYIILFLSRIPIRPRSILLLNIESCERMGELVDTLISGPCMGTLQYIIFECGSAIANQASAASDIANQLRRLEDASLIGLRATCY